MKFLHNPCFLIALVVFLAGCSQSNRQHTPIYNTSTWDGWHDSISQTTQNLSFMGLSLGESLDKIANPDLYKTTEYPEFPHEKILKREDVLSMKYASEGETKTEDNVRRTSYIFDNKIFKIVIETDNRDAFCFMLETFKKRLNCKLEFSEKETISFKNAQMDIDRWDNGYYKTYDLRGSNLGYHSIRNTQYTENFKEGYVYKIIFTDTDACKLIQRIEQKSVESEQDLDEAQKREIERKNDSIRSSLEDQF